MLMLSDYVFYFLGLFTFICAAGVVTTQNPIYSAFYLVLSMVGISGLFVTLDATFVAGVQLIVYAGAVLVLFVMVLMLFDLKHELPTYSKGMLSGFFKLVSAGVLLGLLAGSVYMSSELILGAPPADKIVGVDHTKALGHLLFTKYLFAFELIGALLLIIAIGAVALSRISGGTHADS